MPEPEKKPFYESHWFQGTVAVIGLAAAIWAFAGAPKPWDVAASSFETKAPRSNTEIILDASAAMGEPFGNGTKFDAAVKAIHQYVVPFGEEGLALRRTGGSCEDGGEMLVDFGRDHTDEVADAASAQQPEGVSNLAYAVIEAIGEFGGSDRFADSPEAQQIIIFTAAPEDECIENAPEEIRRELDQNGIEATFKLVALKVSGESRQQLQSFTAALGEHAEVEFVESEEELEEAVEDAQETTLSFKTAIGSTTTEEGEPGEAEETGEDTTTEETGESPPTEEVPETSAPPPEETVEEEVP